MSIKMLKVSFDLPIEVLLKAVADNNVGLDIQAYQTAAPKPPLLEDQSPGSLRDMVLGRLKQTGGRVQMTELHQLAVEHDYSIKQLGNLMYVLYTSKLVSRPAKGVYRITKRGMDY